MVNFTLQRHNSNSRETRKILRVLLRNSFANFIQIWLGWLNKKCKFTIILIFSKNWFDFKNIYTQILKITGLISGSSLQNRIIKKIKSMTENFVILVQLKGSWYSLKFETFFSFIFVLLLFWIDTERHWDSSFDFKFCSSVMIRQFFLQLSN